MHLSRFSKVGLFTLFILFGLCACDKGDDKTDEFWIAKAQRITVDDPSPITSAEYQLIDLKDTNFFYFSAEANQFYAIQSSYFNDEVSIKDSYLDITLYESDGLTIVPEAERSIEFVPTGFVFHALKSGEYFFKVQLKRLPPGSDLFSYNLTIDSYQDDEFSGNNTPATAKVITEVPATLTNLVDLKFLDWYRFDVIEGMEYTVQIKNIACVSGDYSALSITIYQADATTIIDFISESRSPGVHSCPKITFTAAASEASFIAIYQNNKPLWSETYDLEISN